jgi:hypothetical protein
MSNVCLRDKLLLQEPPIYLLLVAQSNKVLHYAGMDKASFILSLCSSGMLLAVGL